MATQTQTVRLVAQSWKPYALACYSVAVLLLFLAYEPARGQAGTAIIVVATCVLLSVSEVLPIWAMTIALWLLAPLLLFRFGEQFAPWNVIRGSLHPMLMVFFTGFMFAAAARRHRIDDRLTNGALRIAAGDHWRLTALIAVVTVWLSAWISNVAAAALMFGTLRHLSITSVIDKDQQRSLLLATALAANLGGMITPISAGPNAIAIAAVRSAVEVNFATWMLFAVPLTIGAVVGALLLGMLIVRPARFHSASRFDHARRPLDRRTAVIFAITIAAWVSEPLHGINAATTALVAALLLVGTRAITWQEVRELDWGTLILIAGGVGIGNVMSRSGAAQAIVNALPLHYSATITLFLLCLLSAGLAGVMSNTGTAALLIPLGAALLVTPSTAILIALATAFGFPFTISTPANVIAVRHGALAKDFFKIGVIAMIGGCAILALTGPTVLAWFGIH